MISAQKILILFYSAYFLASSNILTSKTRTQQYSFLLFSGFYDSKDFIAFITSSLETGPTETLETGIFYEPK